MEQVLNRLIRIPISRPGGTPHCGHFRPEILENSLLERVAFSYSRVEVNPRFQQDYRILQKEKFEYETKIVEKLEEMRGWMPRWQSAIVMKLTGDFVVIDFEVS
jgi:hypothetical protein